MKYNVLIILLLANSIMSMLQAQEAKPYELTGQIEGLQEGEKVVAFFLDPTGNIWDKRDSAYVNKGEFKMQGIVAEGPREYIVAFDKHHWLMSLMIDSGEKITIRSNENLSDFRHSYINNYIAVSGAKYYTSWQTLCPAYWLYEMSRGNLKRMAKAIIDSTGFDGPRINEIFECVGQIDKAFAKEIFTSRPSQNSSELTISFPLIAYTVNYNSQHASFIVDGYNQLSAQMKNSYYGKILKEYSKLCVGQPFPDFTLPTPDGKKLALQDIVHKSKVTLVHFWGADSYLKKQYQDELRIMYNKYHDKGLNIIGFYSDPYTDEWRDLVKKEKYPWYNVSDGKGRDGMVATVYHEYIAPGQKIPNTTNVLIDADGKILAWDPVGVELQWYLWKQLGQ